VFDYHTPMPVSPNQLFFGIRVKFAKSYSTD
jgi:hypothetical protein